MKSYFALKPRNVDKMMNNHFPMDGMVSSLKRALPGWAGQQPPSTSGKVKRLKVAFSYIALPRASGSVELYLSPEHLLICSSRVGWDNYSLPECPKICPLQRIDCGGTLNRTLRFLPTSCASQAEHMLNAHPYGVQMPMGMMGPQSMQEMMPVSPILGGAMHPLSMQVGPHFSWFFAY